MRTIIYTRHALIRLLQRNILRREISEILLTGEVIEHYPNDTPFPSRLILGQSSKRHLHIVCAYDSINDTEIITMYEPNPSEWLPGFKTRNKQ